MLANLPASDPNIERAHELLSVPSDFKMSTALKVFSVEHQRHELPDDHSLINGKVYLLTVPSLNLTGTFHQILVDYRSDSPIVLDPAKGLRFKNYYVWGDPISGLEVPLTSWIIDFEVTPNGG